MLRRLRLKFIASNMAIVAGVLLVAFATVCFADYQQSLQGVRSELAMALDRIAEGAPAQLAPADPSESAAPPEAPDAAAEDAAAPEAEDAGGSTEGAAGIAPPEIGGKRGGSEQTTPIALYVLREDGSAAALDGIATASLSDEVLIAASTELSAADDGTGTLHSLGLHYERRTIDGTVYLAFADMASTSSWESLLPLLAGVGVAALAVFLVIGILFSRWALRPVEQAWNRQQRFVADASHDLKTPLTVILANTSILLEHPERSIGSERQWLESTQREAAGMQRLVEGMLLMAQVDEQAHPPFQRIDLAEAVEAEVLQCESMAFERGLALEGRLEDGVEVMGDEELLRRVAAALLENACKYADEGGRITVTLARAGKEARLEVHNTGPAIPAEDLPHVFERFYRADKARSGDGGSFGLGLAIAHGIVEDHGGTLVAKSSADAGTTFRAAFPLAR